MSMQKTSNLARRITAALSVVVIASGLGPTIHAAAPPAISISQLPLTIAIPAHPQIVFAVANSQSMDGDLSGAIRVGSGSLGANFSQLQNSSSPTSYTIPAGFTPPVNPGAGGVAPYTVNVGGRLVDNSASRLNNAKLGLATVLNNYMSTADFALLDYKLGGTNLYTTWVYNMSLTGGFTFTNTAGASRVINNPCYLADLAAGTQVANDCSSLNAHYGSDITTQQFIVIGQSSDDPDVNDVLYAGGLDPVCVDFGGHFPANPYAFFGLGTYNNGGVTVGYSNSTPGCARTTGPTNAGFVPFSDEVIYSERGFGFFGSQDPNDSNTEVTMTTAGAAPTAASVNAALARFTTALAPETNSTGTREIKSAAGNASTAGLLFGAQNYLATNPPSSNGCTPQRYVVLVTDGLPTLDRRNKAWPPLGSAAAAGYGVTATFNADGSVGATNDQALLDTVAVLQSLASAGIKTYVIGLGAGVDPSKNPVAAATLKAMAVAGGTGDYFPAVSAQALSDDLQVILATILAATQSTAAVAVNSTGLKTGSAVYQAQFVTADTFQDWTGNLYAFAVDPVTGAVNTNPATALWSSRTQLDAQNWDTQRFIATWDPTARTGIPFRWTPGNVATGISINSALGQQLTTFAADTNGQDVVNYLRGNSSQELRNLGKFRNRAHTLGDIVDSNPLYVGKPTGFTQSASYFAFAAANASRPAMVYAGANDGMLHAFDAATGNERFAFIPNGVFANLVNLVDPFYNGRHHFYVDGSPQAADVQFADSSWHTMLVGGEGAGANSIYALDITNPAAMNNEATVASNVRWEFTDANMGLSFSTPSIANTNAGWKVFFGNGYNSPTGTPFLYALDPQTGTVSAKIDLCAAVPGVCNAALPNGLSSVTVMNNGGQLAGAANVVYAGDLQGNLWRIDISSATASSWRAIVILQATDPGGAVQPITVAPAVSLNPKFPRFLGTMVFFVTGKLVGLTDLGVTQTQTVYAVYDPTAGWPPTPLTRSALVQQTLTADTVSGVAVREITNIPVAIPTQKGWFVDLSLSAGERGVTDPRVEGGALVLTSYTPAVNSCTGGGVAFLYALNFANGGVFPLPELDVNNDGKLDASDQSTIGGVTQNPAGMSLGTVYASGATIRPGDGGGSRGSDCGAVALIAKSDNTIQSVCLRSSSMHRTAWREVR
jgi:type IV pilus assembly protein PilY1